MISVQERLLSFYGDGSSTFCDLLAIVLVKNSLILVMIDLGPDFLRVLDVTLYEVTDCTSFFSSSSSFGTIDLLCVLTTSLNLLSSLIRIGAGILFKFSGGGLMRPLY